jgi:predicted membrane protein
MGLLILGVGIIFTLDKLDMVNAYQVLRMWPVLLVIFGVMKIIQSKAVIGRFIGFFIAAGGTLLLLDRYTALSFSFGDYLILMLIVFGISLIWSSFTRPAESTRLFTTNESTDALSVVNAFAFMGGISRKNTSLDFKGGEVSAIMGGCEIDLRHAQIKDDQAVLSVFAFWGGIELRIPNTWTVELDAFPILGGFDDKSFAPQNGNSKILVIRGYAIMGGVEINN